MVPWKTGKGREEADERRWNLEMNLEQILGVGDIS